MVSLRGLCRILFVERVETREGSRHACSRSRMIFEHYMSTIKEAHTFTGAKVPA